MLKLLIGFVSGIALAVGVFTYVPYRFVGWTRLLLATGRSTGVVAGALFLAVLSVVSGCRWAILFVLAYLEFRRRCRWRPGSSSMSISGSLRPWSTNDPGADLIAAST